MKKYINTVSAFQFFHLLRYASLILVGVVFTKTALSATEIGEYETFVFVAGAISFFWLNGLLKAFLPLSSEQKYEKTFVFSAFLLLQFYSIVAAVFMFTLQCWVSETLLSGNAIPELFLLLFFVALSGPAGLVEYYYLAKKRKKAIVVYAIAASSLQFLLVALPVVFGQSIRFAMAGLVISGLIRYLWMWIVMVRNNELRVSKEFMVEHLQLGGPLVTATLLSGSAQFVDGFIVTSHFDEQTFAVFRYGARELPLATLLANALSSAMLPVFARTQNRKETLADLKRRVSRMMHFLFPLSALLLLVSKPLFPVVFNPDFSESATIFNIYLLLVISRLMLPQTILNGLKITAPIMQASFFELVLNVALSLLFVQLWGLPGIAFATFVAYLAEKLFLAAVVKKRLQIAISEYLPTGIYLAYSAGIVLIFIFAELIY